MKKATFSPFDAADYLTSGADIAAYLAAASEEDDPQVLVAAMGDIIRARNVSKIARDAGLTREGVYKAFSAGGNPSFATVVKVAKALDLELSLTSRSTSAKVRRTPQKKRPRRAGASTPNRSKAAQ